MKVRKHTGSCPTAALMSQHYHAEALQERACLEPAVCSRSCSNSLCGHRPGCRVPAGNAPARSPPCALASAVTASVDTNHGAGLRQGARLLVARSALAELQRGRLRGHLTRLHAAQQLQQLRVQQLRLRRHAVADCRPRCTRTNELSMAVAQLLLWLAEQPGRQVQPSTRVQQLHTPLSCRGCPAAGCAVCAGL